MSVELITREDLLQFKTELFNQLKELLQPQHEHKKWLRSSDVRKLLQISSGTLQHLRITGVLPFQKIGGIFYYPQEELIKILENGGKKR